MVLSLTTVSVVVMWESSQWLEKNIVQFIGKKKFQESKDMRASG